MISWSLSFALSIGDNGPIANIMETEDINEFQPALSDPSIELITETTPKPELEDESFSKGLKSDEKVSLEILTLKKVFHANYGKNLLIFFSFCFLRNAVWICSCKL